MKKIRPEMDDWLRPEYRRSDFGELVRGKYAATQVQFAELVSLILGCLGEDQNIVFERHSTGNNLAEHKRGDWTYEIDNGNQITLRYWLNEFGNLAEPVSNSPVISTLSERTKLQNQLIEHFSSLKAKVAELKDRK